MTGLMRRNGVGDTFANYAVAVHRETELHLRRDLVAFGHSHFAHVIAEARDLGSLPVCPRTGSAHPHADLMLDFVIAPVPHHHLAVEAQAAADEPELAVAVGRLVEVHELHVELGPGDVAVELGMQVQ